jgi:TRAP-type C4-dicarboxylate transport system permease small subunit
VLGAAVLVIWRGVLASTMITMTASVGLGIVFRYVLNQPLFWADEVARYALVWLTFLGGAELLRHKAGHIAVEFALTGLGPAWRKRCAYVIDFVMLGLFAVILVGSLIWIERSAHAVSAALALPMPLVYAVIPLSALIAIGIILRRVCKGRPGESEL